MKTNLLFYSWICNKCAISRIPISIPSRNVFFRLLNRVVFVKAWERAVDHRECISVPVQTVGEKSVSIPLLKQKCLLDEAEYGAGPYTETY